MFGKGKLLSEGAQAKALVLESNASYFTSGNTYHVKLRVRFDDGSTFEIRRKVHIKAGFYHEGDILPVRYDPTDRSKVEVDEPALKEHKAAAQAASKQLRLAEGERELEGRTPTD